MVQSVRIPIFEHLFSVCICAHSIPIFSSFIYYLAFPRPILGHYRGDNLTDAVLITAFLNFYREGHREPRNEVESQSLAKRLMVSEAGTFRSCYNALTHWAIFSKSRSLNSELSLHRKLNFSLRISSVNLTKSTGNSGFGHICWRNQ